MDLYDAITILTMVLGGTENIENHFRCRFFFSVEIIYLQNPYYIFCVHLLNCTNKLNGDKKRTHQNVSVNTYFV